MVDLIANLLPHWLLALFAVITAVSIWGRAICFLYVPVPKAGLHDLMCSVLFLLAFYIMLVGDWFHDMQAAVAFSRLSIFMVLRSVATINLYIIYKNRRNEY